VRLAAIAIAVTLLACHQKNTNTSSPDAPTPPTFAIGGTVTGLNAANTLVLANGSDMLAVTSDGAFSFPSRVADGSAYAVSIVTQPAGQACVIAGASGTVSGADVTTIAVTCPHARFVYGVDLAGNTIFAYAVEAGTGRLHPAGIQSTGLAPQGIVIDAIGRHAYTANNDGTVSQFALGDDGTITPLSPPSVAAGSTPSAIAIDPANRHVYVTNLLGKTISQYAVAPDGRLSALTPATVACGQNPSGIVIDPTGRYAYVTNNIDNNVSQYAIDPSGALVALPTPTVTVGSHPLGIAIDQAGHVYVANFSGGTISQLAIGADGSLTPLNPSTVPAGSSPTSIAIDPTGRFVYATNFVDGTVSQYSVAASGALTAIAAPTVFSDGSPQAIAADIGVVYVTNQRHGFAQFAIAGNGALAPLAPKHVGAPGTIESLAISRGTLAVQPAARAAYVADGGNDAVVQFGVTSGTLAPLSPPTVAAGIGLLSASVDPFGAGVYVANGGADTLGYYTLDGTGHLNAVGTTTTGVTPFRIAVHSSGQFLYVVTNGDGKIWQYAVTSGVPTPLTPANITSTVTDLAVDSGGRNLYGVAATGIAHFTVAADGTLGLGAAVLDANGPHALALDPAGRFLYVATTGGTPPHSIDVFPIQSDGSLAAKSSSALADNSPTAIAFHPSGRTMYVVNQRSHDVSQYAVNSDGSLSAMTPAAITAGTDPIAIAVDPSGQAAFVVDDASHVVWQFSIDANGGLAAMATPSIAAGAIPTSIALTRRYR
jgi:YVTN family beta-propeller protein